MIERPAFPVIAVVAGAAFSGTAECALVMLVLVAARAGNSL